MRIRKGVSIERNKLGETRFGVREPNSVGFTNAPVKLAPTVSVAARRDGPRAETADAGAGGGGAQPGGVTDIVAQNMLVDVLASVIPTNDPLQPNTTVNRIYRDMYHNDATCGSAVVLRSTIPFSEFTLSGLRDEKMLDVFQQSVESMNINALLPQLSTEHDVFGAFLGSMAWNESKKRYSGICPHNLDLARFEQIPAFGIDPKISITLDARVVNSLRDSKFVQQYGEFIPDDIKKLATEQTSRSGSTGTTSAVGVELSPEHTIFIPRGGLLSDFTGMSLFRRALPAWLYEKALIMGTHDQVYKRQKGTTHITVENTEDWVADQGEMDSIATLFMNASLDPMGSVVVTRSGVNVNEVNPGGQFWRWDESYGQIETIKLRALGISESFVTAEANYNTMEQSLSVFMEQIRDYRIRITFELFYNKMFPMIAYKNGITKRRYGRRQGELAALDSQFYDRDNVLHGRVAGLRHNMELANSGGIRINPSDFVIPQVHWQKRLLPEADVEYIGMLQQMQDLGLPINIRGLAAAGGFSVDDIVAGIDDDLRIRRRVGEWRKQIGDINKEAEPDTGMGGEDGEGGDVEEMARFMVAQELGAGTTQRRHLGSFANPDQAESEFVGTNHRGNRRPLTPKGRNVLADRFARNMGAAAAEIARQQNAQARIEQSQREPLRKLYHAR